MAELADFYRSADRGAQVSSPHQQEIVGSFFDRALARRPVIRALDLGSGRGANVRALASRFSCVVAADVSEEALVESRETHADLGDKVDFTVLPGRGLPFRDGSFELSVCTEVLEHVDDPFATGAELERVTVTGGHLVISSPNYRNVMGLVKTWKDWRSGTHDFDPWDAHRGGFEGFMTAPKLRSLFPNCDLLEERGADYAFALGIRWGPARRRLSKYLLLRPGYGPMSRWGMQYYILLRKR